MRLESNALLAGGSISFAQPHDPLPQKRGYAWLDLLRAGEMYSSRSSNEGDLAWWGRLLSREDASHENAVQVYDAFLSMFPFCFGYWDRYARLVQDAEIYERALERMKGSVDTWERYVSYLREKSLDYDDVVRRATVATRGNPRSLRLWSHRRDGFEDLATWPHPELDWVERRLNVTLDALKEKWVQREPYESRIRDFYHPTPLTDIELNAWRAYVEFDPSPSLRERCLIACADYPDFLYFFQRQQRVSDEDDNGRVFVSSVEDVRVAHSLSLQARGDNDAALRIVPRILRYLESKVAVANLERRLRNSEAACETLEADSRLASILASYRALVLNDVNAARVMIEEAGSLRLLYYHLEATTSLDEPFRHRRILRAIHDTHHELDYLIHLGPAIHDLIAAQTSLSLP